MNWQGYHELDWLDFEWSEWLSLDPDDGELGAIPTDVGLYRVRNRGHSGLSYVGETGRSLRGRIRALARGTYADEMPYRDPHVGAPCMWAIRNENGPEFEVSYISPAEASDKASRKSIEAALIASYRRAEGESPTGAFSRIIPGYRMSSYSKEEERGGLLPNGESESYAEPGIPPLDWESYDQPLSQEWMGLDWSNPTSLTEVSTAVPPDDGVYIIWDPESELPFEYIGESANLRSRLRTHSRNRQNDLQFSWAAPSSIDAKHKRLEAETDLIGAHWLALKAPPRDQH